MFDDVPFVKAKCAGNPDRDPNRVVERRMVALLGYPCDIYEQGRLVKVQSVASGAPTWAEIALWQRWNEVGQDPVADHRAEHP